jgi:tetratricopeptide (TPR) repeat protein
MYYKNYKEALKYFNKANSLNPDTNDIKVIYNIGLINQITNQYPEAIKNYNIILDMDSSMVNVYYNLADIYFENREIQKAINYNLNATKYSPKDDKPYINIGKIYFTINDTVNSIEYLKKAYHVNPNNELTNRVLKKYNLIP